MIRPFWLMLLLVLPILPSCTKIGTIGKRIYGTASRSDGGGGSYSVRGCRYHVMTRGQARNYRETGVASYYGGGSHREW